MKKTYKVGFKTLEEVIVRNFIEIEASSEEEAVNKLKEIIDEVGNPYSSNDESIKDIGWEDGNVFDVIENSNGIYDDSEDIFDLGYKVEQK